MIFEKFFFTTYDLTTTAFSTIWQSEKAKTYRQKQLAHSHCQSCEHFAICNGACPLYWRQVGFQELKKNE